MTKHNSAGIPPVTARSIARAKAQADAERAAAMAAVCDRCGATCRRHYDSLGLTFLGCPDMPHTEQRMLAHRLDDLLRQLVAEYGPVGAEALIDWIESHDLTELRRRLVAILAEGQQQS